MVLAKANYINNMFADVSVHVLPLDFDELPAYLPTKDPPPHLYPWEVYNELRKINPNKSSGPDGVSARLIKEFAYEISVPFTDILNCSFKEGIVPHQWKKAIVVHIPKQTRARMCVRHRRERTCFHLCAINFILFMLFNRHWAFYRHLIDF